MHDNEALRASRVLCVVASTLRNPPALSTVLTLPRLFAKLALDWQAFATTLID